MKPVKNQFHFYIYFLIAQVDSSKESNSSIFRKKIALFSVLLFTFSLLFAFAEDPGLAY